MQSVGLPKLTERMWAAQLDKLARMFGWAMWRDNATNAPRRCPKCHAEIHLPRNEAGWPDRIYLRGDTLYVIELKADRGKTTEAQEYWLAAFRAVRKIRVSTWRPRQIDEIARLLR